MKAFSIKFANPFVPGKGIVFNTVASSFTEAYTELKNVLGVTPVSFSVTTKKVKNIS